jgi:hypothetical protein
VNRCITRGLAGTTSPPVTRRGGIAPRPQSTDRATCGERSTPDLPARLSIYLDNGLIVGMGRECCSSEHYYSAASQNDVHANGKTELAAEGWLLNMEGRLSNGDGSMVNVASDIPDLGMPPRGWAPEKRFCK